MNFIKATLLTIVLSLATKTLHAQEIHGEPNVWFLLLTHYKINDNLKLGNELHLRYDDYLNDKQQLLIRPFINYNTSKNKNVIYSFGYTYIKTYPYGDYPLDIAQPENNIWEQVTVNQQLGKMAVSHRYRLEQRWQGNIVRTGPDAFEIDGTTFSNRFRYRITLTRPLTEKMFVNIFDELWVKANDDLKSIGFDRNWLYLGLGYKFSDMVAVQGAYLHQYAQNNPTRFERHPSFQVTISADF